ncbi:MAG: ABC transporter substrate-binding protein [Deltaproteobacteria bacterium]|nr:ABC transporter substrate-binding protein [Deltaproteobacteria bacterium]
MKHAGFNIALVLIFITVSLGLLSGCGNKVEFEQFGGFSVKYLDNGCKEVTDGIGRKLLLAPWGYRVRGKYAKAYAKANIIRIPVKKVVVYSTYNAALIKVLGHVDSIDGVVTKKEDWYIPEIRKGIDRGRIVYLGQSTSIDYERLKRLKPDVVFTWDEGIVPKLEELSIPCVVTSTRIAKDLSAHINFIRFISAFYGDEQQAKAFAASQFEQIKKISARLRRAGKKPTVIWGDIYARKVQVEPGNSWAGQMVGDAGGDYLFRNLEGST